MKTKKGFNRFVSVLLSFAIIISTFAGLSLNSIMPVSANTYTSDDTHFIIKLWHATESENETKDVTLDGFIHEDKEANKASLYIKDGTSDYVLIKEFNNNAKPGEWFNLDNEESLANKYGVELKFNYNADSDNTLFVRPKANDGEEFAGFAVSAGNDCVDLKSSEETPYFTIRYGNGVHIVKVHAFYSEKPKLVPGTEMTVGTEDSNIGKYEDTKTQTWKSLGDDLQKKIKDAIADDRLGELLTGDGEIDSKYIKLYNTSEGLHTDKTATPVYNGDENDAGTTTDDKKQDGENVNGTRVFDINLEAWYNDQAIAKVGLILDASGSMAFISDGLTPMHFDFEEGNGYKLSDGSYVQPKQYLTPDQVNKILDKNLTDNSKLSYSGYTYYIFDARDFTQEFVPLAYWGGDNGAKPEYLVPQYDPDGKNNHLLGFWDFNETSGENRQIINRVTGEAATVYKKDSSGKYTENNGSNIVKDNFKDGGHYNYDYKNGRTFSLSEFSVGENAVALDVKPTSNTFTVSFIVGHRNNDKTYNPERILFIGDKSNDVFTVSDKDYNATSGYNFYEIGKGDNSHLRFGAYNKNKTSRINNVFDKQINTSSNNDNIFHFVTMVFSEQPDGKVKYTFYKDGKLAQNNTSDATGSLNKDDTLSNILSSENFAMMLGGDTQSNNFKIYIDDLFLFDTALSDDEVSKLYNNVKKIDENGYDATDTPASVNAVDSKGNVFATFDSSLTKGDIENRAGWYFVNSGSDLEIFYNEEVGTAKILCGLRSGEVIANEIDLTALPKSVQDFFDKKEEEVGNGNGGYIATSGKDFTGTGQCWDKTDGSSSKNVGTDEDVDPAITVPKDVERQYIDGNSPCVFFIDSAGYLRCFYNNGGNTKADTDELRSGVSYVYQKGDSTDIKSDDLQYALGQFAAQLHNATPNSMVSAVRFSTSNMYYDSKNKKYSKATPTGSTTAKEEFLKQLILLDWTSDTKEISQILSLERGDGGSNDKVNSDPTDKDLAAEIEALAQYNYGMTGGTYTWTGFQAYKKYLDSRIKEDDPAKKYIILFTDGMDNTLDDGSDDEQNYAVNLAKALKEKGYTIFCVVLRNKTFETGSDETTKTLNRGERVQQYMAKIAGNKETDKETYSLDSSSDEYAEKYKALSGQYIFEADDVEGLTSAFTGEILSQISSSLIDYSVQDYIDPRFDLVDRTGSTIVLGKGGKVTIKDTEGKVTEETTLGDVPKGYSNKDAIGTIHNIDGAEAVLCYNSDKDRYYLEWVEQNIPGTTPKENSLTIWSRTFRIKAKEDFIGGNAILSNGKEEKENWVFNPNDTDENSGITDAKVDKGDVDETTGALNDPYVSKGFPRTTVNVRLLKPSISDASDEIYMGETISPKEVAKDIIQIVKNDCYWDYLGRYYSRDPLGELKKAGKTVSSSSYDTAFENAIADLLDGTVEGTAFKVDDYEGLKDYLTSKGIVPTTINTAHKLTVPYMYLPDKAGTDYTNTVGDENYQKDQTGSITYMIIQNTPNDELGGDVLTKDTKKRSYIIWVQFTADQIEDDADDENDKPREKAIETLVNETVEEENVYPWDKEYKPAAGEEQKEKHIAGPYEVDIVAGEIILECELSSETLAYLKNHFPGTTITYNADLMRSYNGLTADEKVGTFTVVINCDGDNPTTKATFKPDTNYEDRIPTYGLPIGTYTLLNENTTIGGESATNELKNLLGECFKFDSAKAVDVIEKYYEHFKGYSDIETVSATYDDTEKAELKAEHSDKAVYLGWNGTAKTTDYLKDRLGVFLIKGDIDTGSLSITKKVEYDTDKYGDYNDETVFKFEVKLDAYGEFNYTITKDGAEQSKGTIGKTSEAFGTREITLKRGETFTIEDIPVGTTFTVTEVTIPGGYTADSATANGEIEKAGTTVTVTNTYSASGELELKVAKVIEGREWINDDEFEFTVERTDKGITDAVTMPESTTVTISKDTEEHSASFGNITFNRIGTYTFTVTETSGDKNGLTSDKTVYTVTVVVSEGSGGKLNLKVTYVTVTEGTSSDYETPLTFTNKAKPVEWSFDVEKNLTGRDWLVNEEFTFDVKTSDEDKAAVDKNTVTVSETENPAKVNVTFSAEGEYTFTVKEQGENGNGLTYDTTEHKIVVTVKANETTGELEVTSVTVDGEPAVVASTSLEITNEYKASGNAEFTVRKTLTGRKWTTDDKFTFTLTADEDNPKGGTITLPEKIELSNNDLTEDTVSKKFNINFEGITFDDVNSKEYNFTLKENIPDPNPSQGITYSDKTYKIKVTVTDNSDGTISTKVDVVETEDNIAAFTNTYKADSVTWAPKVSKTLSGRKWKNDDKFTFNIELTEGNSDNVTFTDTGKTVTINGTDTDKTKSFEDITFSDAGKYTFTVSEVTPTDKIPGVAYSETKYTVTVTVADDGDGQLVITEITYENSITGIKTEVESDFDGITLPFTNTYTAEGEAKFKVQKTLEGREWKEGETFTFTLEADDANPTGGTITLPEGIELGYDDISETATDKTIAGNTFTIEFEGISFDDADSKTYTYYLTENKKEPSNGINYDGNRYTIKVTVTDNGDGTISTKVMVNEIEGATAEFTNTYKATNPATWEPSVTKELEGRDWIDGDSFEFTITADNNNPKGASLTTDETITIEGTDAGTGKDKTKSFGGITFNEVGEYKFTISEVKPKTPAPDENGRINGIEYSKTEYTVTVTIADDGEGNLYVASISYTTNSSTAETTVGKESVEGLKFSFTNVYAVQPVEWTVTVEKQIIDRENTGRDKNWTDADKFEFTIEPDKDNPAKVTFKDDKTTIEINNKSTKDVINGIIRSGEFGAITFSEAGTYKFTVAEKDSEVGGILYDTNVYTLTVDVKDDNNGRLYIDSVDCTSSDHDSPEPTISDNNTKISLSFINVHDHTTVSWVPSVTKDLKGRDWNGDSFNFKLEYQGEQVGTSIIKDTNKVTMGNNTAKVTSEGITYFSKDTVVFHEIGTYVFTISEVKPTDPKPDENGRINGIKYSDTKYEVTVKVKDDGTGQLEIESVTSDGKDYANQSFTFENDYTASGEAKFTVQKTLEGRDWKEGESFKFIITADHLRNPIDSTVILPDSIVLSNEIGKPFTIKFEDITFKEGETEKTYYFTLKENDSDNVPGMTYDKTEYEIKVTVKDEDHDGKLETTVEVIDTKDDTQAKDNVAAFTNTYKPASTSWTPKVSKTLTGRNWINGDSFTFNITLDGTSDYVTFTEGGKTVIISGTDEEKIKSFGEITFTKEGTYTFTISEEGTDDNGLTYDKHVYNVKVTVVDDKQGNLNITNISYTDKESKEITVTSDFDGITFEFENNYRSKSVDWTVTVEKQINDLERTGRDENWTDDDVFTFTITTNNTDGVTFNGSKTVTLSNKLPIIDKIRTGEFGTITFTKAGKYTFTVRETKGTVGGMHYDTTVYTITVTVSDNNEGSLYIENVSYNTNKPKVSDDKTEITLPFTNIHHHDAVSFTPSVTKDLEGRDWDGDSFNFTLEYKGEQVGAELVYDENTHKVNIRDSSTTVESEKTATPFPDAIVFHEIGTYVFTVSEQDLTAEQIAKGLTKDPTVYTIIVTVKSYNGTETGHKDGELYIDSLTVNGKEYDPTKVVLSFTNNYTASGKADVKFKKTINGRKWKDGDKFSFTLTPETGYTGVTIPDIIQLSDDKEATFAIEFKDIAFSEGETKKTYTFTLKEDDSSKYPGMTYDKTVYTIEVTVTDSDHDGELETTVKVIGTKDDVAAFTNTYKAASTSWTPKVSKTLTGRNWINGDSFTFTIEHTPITGGPANGVTMPAKTTTAASGTIGTNTAADASFDAIEFTEAGTYGFTIKEVGTDGNGLTYDKHVYNVTVTIADDQDKGELYVESISYDTTKIERKDVDSHKFSFTNTYTDKPVDWTVSINKILEGREGDWLDGIDVFKFFISPENDYGTNVDMPTKNYIQIDKNSKNTEGVRSAYFDTITFNKKGDYTFKVYEEQGTAGGILYDSTEHILTVHVGSDNKGNLVITSVEHDTDADHAGVDETWTGASAENVQLTFVNHHSHKAVDWKPSVQKTLSGRDWVKGDSFKFRITYNGVVDKNKIIMPTDTTTSVVSSESKSFNTIRFVEIGEYTFTVNEELSSDQAAKGLTKDTKAYTIVVTVKSYNGTETGHEDGELYIERITVNGEDYDPAKDVVLPFTNKYSASGAADLTVQKTLEGKEWNGDNFTFTLTPDADYEGVTLPEIGLSSAAEKIFKINFKDITFDSGNSKVYNFTLTENGGNYPGMIYDKTKYTIKVTVTDNHDGTISSTVEVVGTEDNVAAFKNTYEPNSTKWTPKVSKTLSGREWKDGDSFTFSIALDGTSDYVTFTEGGKTVIISGTDAEKIKSFGEITFTKAGTYAFTVSEEGIDGNGLTYDKHVYKVNVTVTDNGNGSLKVSSITYEDSQVSDKFDDITFEFVNKYEPKPVDWTPSVTKVITYKPTWESNYKFDFTITPPTGTDGVKYAENTVTADSEHHTVNFPTVTFTAAGKYEFTVQEKQGDISAVKYDTAPHKIIVTVEDINGTLTITDVSGTDTGSDSNLTITNTYSTKVSWPPLVEKNIDGKYWKDGDAFTFTLSLAPDSPNKVGPEAMPDDITLTFADVVSLKKAEKAFEGVKFTEPGTYKFILKESTQSSGNMICDSSQYIITVVVTRDDNGELVVSPSAMKQDASGYTQEAGSYSFTNTYKPEQTDVTIYVEKELDGWKDNDGGFTFDITLTNGNSANVIMPDLTFLTVTKDVPTASFDKIIFTAEGDYEFTVAEREGTNDKIIYAKSQKVTVKVRADESTGKLVASVDGGDSTKTLKFVNHYISNTKLPKGTIIITKVLENWKDGDSFTFEIKLTSGNAESVVFADNIATVTATKDAPTASFGDIIFTAEGEYTFTITELSNADDGIIYDTSEYTVTVNVKRDDEHYTLQITDGLDEVNFTFTNSYKTSDDPTPPDEDGDEDEDNPSTGVLPNLTALATATLAMATALFLKKKRSKK